MLAFIRSVIAALHNIWAQGPINTAIARTLWPAVQAAIVLVVFALWQFVLGFGWTVPPDPTNLHAWLAELLNAGTLAWAIAYPLITTRVWPALVPYLMTLLNLIYEVPAAGARGYKPTRVVALWAPAA